MKSRKPAARGTAKKATVPAKKVAAKGSAKSQGSPAERRKAPRRPILESFALFIVIPSKGFHRLKVHDVSEHGLGFDVDAEGEDPGTHPLAQGDRIEVHFYVNPSLYLPLGFQVLRIEDREGVRRVGGEIEGKKSKEYAAFLLFLKMLDQLRDAGRLASGG